MSPCSAAHAGCIVVVLAMAGAVAASEPSRFVTSSRSVPSSAGAPPRGVRDRVELEAFLDGLMTANLADKHIAGATVAVVRDGVLFFAKGYGYADVEHHAPVDPARTLFRVGSATKLFTWTAIMQLVEQGKVDLDGDVNEYLDFKIPSTYPQAITLKHVMTHTTGFEDDVRDLFTTDAAKIVPLRRWLEAHIPERVRPPGTYSSHSNYATALAGYVVERVSGMPWEDYVEQHILGPLQMTHATVRQPLRERFRRDMSHHA
jgi:CubicO group peptidase (beta-lactamase class C family)